MTEFLVIKFILLTKTRYQKIQTKEHLWNTVAERVVIGKGDDVKYDEHER